MHHGTCSDYNQYCPNARLPKNHHSHPSTRQYVPLAAQSVGNLRGPSNSHSNPYSYESQHQSQQQLHCDKNNCEQLTPQKFRRPTNRNHNNIQSNHSSRPRSHTLHSAESPKPTTNTVHDHYYSTSATAAYHPLLLSDCEEHQEQSFPRNHHHRHQPLKPLLIQNLHNSNNNNFRSGACACCSHSAASSTGDSAGPSALDYYQEHIYQFFYRRNNNNIMKGPGSVSGRSTSTLTSPQHQLQSPTSGIVAGSTGPGGGDHLGVSSNVDFLLLLFTNSFTLTLLTALCFHC